MSRSPKTLPSRTPRWLSFLIASASVTLAPLALAAEPPAPAPAPAAPPPVAPASPAPAAPPPVAPVAPPAVAAVPPPASAEATAATPSQTSAEVLRLYVAADDAAALRTVHAGLERCEVVSRRECPDKGRALLLRDLGIVEAGGRRDHKAAVAAFREALRLDPELGIPPELAIERVRAAFVEAGGTVPAPPAEEVETAAAVDSWSGEAQPTSRYESGDAFLLLLASFGTSGDASGSYAGDVRGAASGLWHVAGPFAVGARLSAGALELSGNTPATMAGDYGVVGPAALAGVLLRGKRNTGYFLFGAGADYIPGLSRAVAVFSLAMGASIRGFTIGGMPAFSVRDGFVGGQFAFQLGWGMYVSD